MTAYSPADLPSSVDTVEELVVWGLSILNENFPNNTIVEAPGRANRMAELAPFYIDSSTPQQWCVIGRIIVPLSSTWRQSGKIWQQVTQIGTTAIPNGYRTN